MPPGIAGEKTYTCKGPPPEGEGVNVPKFEVRKVYLRNRLKQLDYAHAEAHHLPIGSGEIESAHRYIIQKRLKLPGAWWKIEHARHLLNLRVMRANGGWENYWHDFKQAA